MNRDVLDESDEARLRTGLRVIADAVVASREPSAAVSRADDGGPGAPTRSAEAPRSRRRGLAAAAVAVVLGAGATVIAIRAADRRPANVEPVRTGSTPGPSVPRPPYRRSRTAAELAASYVERLREQAGAHFAADAVEAAVADREVARIQHEVDLWTYLLRVDPERLDRPIDHTDLIRITGTTAGGHELVLTVLRRRPDAGSAHRLADRPAFGYGSYRRTTRAHGVSEWTRLGIHDGRSADVEIHIDGVVVGVTVESRPAGPELSALGEALAAGNAVIASAEREVPPDEPPSEPEAFKQWTQRQVTSRVPMGVADESGTRGYVDRRALDARSDRALRRALDEDLLDRTAGVSNQQVLQWLAVLEPVEVRSGRGVVVGYVTDHFVEVSEYEVLRDQAEAGLDRVRHGS